MAVVAAVAASDGAPVSVPGGWRADNANPLQLNRVTLSLSGITDAQIAAAQFGRLTAFAKSFSYIFWSVLPWSVLGAVGESRWRQDPTDLTDATNANPVLQLSHSLDQFVSR
jgi:hypothetical protein